MFKLPFFDEYRGDYQIFLFEEARVKVERYLDKIYNGKIVVANVLNFRTGYLFFVIEESGLDRLKSSGKFTTGLPPLFLDKRFGTLYIVHRARYFKKFFTLLERGAFLTNRRFAQVLLP